LAQAVAAAGIGRVLGGGTFLVAERWGTRSNVLVEVSDLEAGVRVLRHTLRELQVPPATWIWQYEPEEVCYEVWFDEENPPAWGW
jgi:hypothetical protein